MTVHLSASGVVGSAGRHANGQDGPVRSAELHLTGQRLPLLSPARLYLCGITPYDITHLGHAATFVWADAVTAVMRMTGVEVVTCRNVTDVDDVLTAAAAARGRHYDEFALHQEYLFGRDMQALRVRPPTHEPRARHHIGAVQQLAAALLATGHAYQREGLVYFRGADVPARAGLSREQALALSAEYGDEPDDPLRDDPFDVPVWRPSDEQHPAWPSPWGWGRPGWHAECAAMALSVLGRGLDLLAGGEDLRYPHHAYQAALAEAATSTSPFTRSTLHVGAVRRDGTKMAKSTGNLVLVADLLQHTTPAALRLLLLDRRWNTAWDYTDDQLPQAAARLERLYSAAGRPSRSPTARDAVTGALVDNLDVPHAAAIAEHDGGDAARHLLRVLALS